MLRVSSLLLFLLLLLMLVLSSSSVIIFRKRSSAFVAMPWPFFQRLFAAKKRNNSTQIQSNKNTYNNMSAAGNTMIPQSLLSPPVAALVPPGQCQFGPDVIQVPLLERTAVSETSSVLRFGLPMAEKPLGLSTCACLLAVTELNGETVVRPYTPISTNDQATAGYFDLLVKNYGPTAKMSRHLHEIPVGDTSVGFKHIPVNVKIQATEFLTADHILMLVGGTGITPMIQALHAILGSEKNENGGPKVTVLYGSRVSNDILGKELLDQWEKGNSDRLEVVHVLSNEPAYSDWTGLRGFIDKELIASKFPAASDASQKLLIFVCGPPPMYNALSGPREETGKVSGLLGEMGYTPEQVYKF